MSLSDPKTSGLLCVAHVDFYPMGLIPKETQRDVRAKPKM